MDHHPAQLAVHVRQLLHAQPVEQYVAVFCQHDALQIRIDLALFFFRARADRQQRQVVIAKHHHAVRAQRVHQAQRFQRLPTAVDQIAAEPQRVLGRVEPDLFQQLLGDVVATLQIANCPDAHRACSLNAASISAASSARSARRRRLAR